MRVNLASAEGHCDGAGYERVWPSAGSVWCNGSFRLPGLLHLMGLAAIAVAVDATRAASERKKLAAGLLLGRCAFLNTPVTVRA